VKRSLLMLRSPLACQASILLFEELIKAGEAESILKSTIEKI